jgi:hypothetical protein
MKAFTFTFFVYYSLTMACALNACQDSDYKYSGDTYYSDDTSEAYDYVYDQLEKESIRKNKHAAYAAKKAQEQFMWHLSQQEPSYYNALRKQKKEIAKIRVSVNKFLEKTFEERGIDSRKIDVHIKLSFKDRSK